MLKNVISAAFIMGGAILPVGVGFLLLGLALSNNDTGGLLLVLVATCLATFCASAFYQLCGGIAYVFPVAYGATSFILLSLFAYGFTYGWFGIGGQILLMLGAIYLASRNWPKAFLPRLK